MTVAEKVTVQGGGCVVRLAGLYSVQRGPHSVWLDEKSVSTRVGCLLFSAVLFFCLRAVYSATKSPIVLVVCKRASADVVKDSASAAEQPWPEVKCSPVVVP